jgi:hypothetical protein
MGKARDGIWDGRGRERIGDERRGLDRLGI